MSDLDPFIRETIQKSVEGQIERNVYDKIKGELRVWRLLGIGGGVLGGFLLAMFVTFQKPIFSKVVEWGGQEFQNQLESLLTETKVRARIAREDMEKFRTEVGSTYEKTNNLASEVDKKYKELSKTGADLNEQVRLVEERAADALSRIAQVRVEIDDMIRRYNAIVADLMKQKEFKVTAVPAQQPSPDQELRRRATVYFQFAGSFERSRAVAISKEIAKAGWNIPGEQRVANRANEIRYHPDDAKVAALLQRDANAALQALGMRITLTIRERSDVRQGIPEIWIYEP